MMQTLQPPNDQTPQTCGDPTGRGIRFKPGKLRVRIPLARLSPESGQQSPLGRGTVTDYLPNQGIVAQLAEALGLEPRG